MGAPEEAVGFGVVLRAMETHGTTKVGLPDGPPFFRFSDADESRGALSRAGFTAVAVRTLPLVWRLPSGEALFEAALHGGVRTSAALQAQTPEALAAIRRAVLSRVAAICRRWRRRGADAGRARVGNEGVNLPWIESYAS